MRKLMFLLTLLTVPALGFSATIHVPGDYPLIQDAVSAAVNGDTVLVAPGIYVENIDFLGKTVTVASEGGCRVTTIDGNRAGSVVSFKSGEGTESVLRGFTVTNGSGTYYPGWGYAGGGVYCKGSSPTIKDNLITGNACQFGGGVECIDWSSPMISNNTIIDNTAMDQGDCSGGGIAFSNHSSPTISGNIIADNYADNTGGGIVCYDACFPSISGNIFSGNTAFAGGGIFAYWNCHPVLTNNTFTQNSASLGGALFGYVNCTLTVTNCILWNDDAPVGLEVYLGDSTGPSSLMIDFSDVLGGQNSIYTDPNCTVTWGGSMIDADPLFADAAAGDFHLTWDSPCRNTGDNSAVITELFDFEGDPRIAQGTVDMGADEFHTHLYHIGGVVPGSPIEVKVVGDPGTAPVTLALGSGIQNPPRPTPYGDLYLALPPLRTFNLGAVPSNGIVVKPATVPKIWQSGESYPFQALVGPLGNPNSVLSNLLTLTVE